VAGEGCWRQIPTDEVTERRVEPMTIAARICPGDVRRRGLAAALLLLLGCASACGKRGGMIATAAYAEPTKRLFLADRERFVALKDLALSRGSEASEVQKLAAKVGVLDVWVGGDDYEGSYGGMVAMTLSVSGNAMIGESISLIYAGGLDQELVTHHETESRVHWFAILPNWWVQVTR
jgi:hypothetical protein